MKNVEKSQRHRPQTSVPADLPTGDDDDDDINYLNDNQITAMEAMLDAVDAIPANSLLPEGAILAHAAVHF